MGSTLEASAPSSATVREIAQGADEFVFHEGVEDELRGLAGRHVVHELHWHEARSVTQNESSTAAT